MRDVQADTDYYISTANNFDNVYKKASKQLEQMRSKIRSGVGAPYATVKVKNSVKGPVYVL